MLLQESYSSNFKTEMQRQSRFSTIGTGSGYISQTFYGLPNHSPVADYFIYNKVVIVEEKKRNINVTGDSKLLSGSDTCSSETVLIGQQ